jgi:hypothetical protein
MGECGAADTTILLCELQYILSSLSIGKPREWFGTFPDWGPLTKDSATKLKGDQLNVCTELEFLNNLWGLGTEYE